MKNDLVQNYQSEKTSKSKKIFFVVSSVIVAVLILLIAIVLAKDAGSNDSYPELLNSAQKAFDEHNYDDAILYLNKAIELNDSEEARLLLAQSHAEKSEYAKAIEVLEVYLSKNKSDAVDKLLAEYRETLARLEETSFEIAGQTLKGSSSILAITGKNIPAEELELIGKLTELRSLSITSCSLGDISFLAPLTKLETLILSNNKIENIAVLENLTKLRTLYLNSNPLGDLSPLHKLKNLTTLDIGGRVIGERELLTLKNALPGCSIYSDDTTPDIKDITLGGKTFKSDVTELNLSGLKLRDISAVSACKNLVTLNLNDNLLTDLTPLLDLPKLRHLALAQNSISDITPLIGMRELVYLDLSHNSVKNIKAVSALVNLTELSLRGNPIEDFSPLLGLSALKTLNLAATGLNDESLARLRSLSKLTSLNIEDNEDLTGVAVEEFKIQMSRCSVTHSELIFTVALGGKEFRTDSEAILASELGISDISPLIQFEKTEDFEYFLE
jgi:Leucine-rich repeat (LRR) protein